MQPKEVWPSRMFNVSFLKNNSCIHKVCPLKINETGDLRDEAFKGDLGSQQECVTQRNCHLVLLKRLNGRKEIQLSLLLHTDFASEKYEICEKIKS